MTSNEEQSSAAPKVDEPLVEPPDAAYGSAELEFVRLRPKYDKLVLEVEYILRSALRHEDIPISSITTRVKATSSFADKIRRKSYADPLGQTTDCAGARIVCYYKADLEQLDRVIGTSFRVLERVDKSIELGTNKFGYTAVHYIVCLSMSCSGARYDDLHGLKCEIQTRAVLEDAWAVVNHHLTYKKESEIPDEFRRRLNTVAATLETCQREFGEIRKGIETHLAGLKPKPADDLLRQPVNSQSVASYIKRTNPELLDTDVEHEATVVSANCDKKRFATIEDIDKAVSRTKKALAAFRNDQVVHRSQEIEYAVAFVDPAMRGIYRDWFKALFVKHLDLVEQ